MQTEAEERKLFKHGEHSFAVTLPIAWARRWQLQYGDKVVLVINDDLVIRAKESGRKSIHLTETK